MYTTQEFILHITQAFVCNVFRTEQCDIVHTDITLVSSTFAFYPVQCISSVEFT